MGERDGERGGGMERGGEGGRGKGETALRHSQRRIHPRPNPERHVNDTKVIIRDHCAAASQATVPVCSCLYFFVQFRFFMDFLFAL